MLTAAEGDLLLEIAHRAIDAAVCKEVQPVLDCQVYPEALRSIGASFVTVYVDGELRGCLGSLEAHQPLAEDVAAHAIAAVQLDPRFSPVCPSELERIALDISCLTPAVPLVTASAEELLSSLRPGIDGVLLEVYGRRGTFLPQVWHTLPDPDVFLNRLCKKMHLPADAWRSSQARISTYQVQEFKRPAQNSVKLDENLPR